MEAASASGSDPRAFIRNPDLFGDLAGNERFAAAYEWALSSLHAIGARDTLQALVSRLELRDVKANKVIWSAPGMQFSETYEVSTAATAGDANAFLRQDANALDRLASEFARAAVSAMLEAF